MTDKVEGLTKPERELNGVNMDPEGGAPEDVTQTSARESNKPDAEFVQKFEKWKGFYDRNKVGTRWGPGREAVRQLERVGMKPLVSEVNNTAHYLNALEYYATMDKKGPLSAEELRNIELLTKEELSKLSGRLGNYLNPQENQQENIPR